MRRSRGIATTQNKSGSGPILEDLPNYVSFHFTTEETYFKKFGYPEYVQHKKQHDELIPRKEKSHELHEFK